MRLNPVYQAAMKFKNQPLFHSKPEFRKNKSDTSYCLMQLPEENTLLTIAGTIYQPVKNPHISIYEYYKQSETKGLGVFHYTWYGEAEENNTTVQIVLHVYFDRMGRYLSSQVKSREPGEIIKDLSIAEEKAIAKHAKEHSQDTLHNLLKLVTVNYTSLEEQVDSYLGQLEKLSIHIKTQLPKYKSTAQLCINAMREKDIWSFGNVDPRANLLLELISHFEEDLANQQKQNKQNHGFYLPIEGKQEKQEPEKKQRAKKTIVQPLPISLAVTQKLSEIEKRFRENEENDKITEAEKSLFTLELLNKKFEILMSDRSPLVVNDALTVLQQINQHHVDMKLLFLKKMSAGDIEAMQCLRPFVLRLHIYDFLEQLETGNLAVCQYLVQNFDECLLYLNVVCPGTKEKCEETGLRSFTLLQFVLVHHKTPQLLEMLLQNGADPDLYGETGENRYSLLCLSIEDNREDYVRILLENGANPNPETKNVNSIEIPTNKVSNPAAIRKAIQNQNCRPNSSVPLFKAIAGRNRNIIALLLKFDASLTKQHEHKFDALGQETCENSRLPDRDIVELLVKHGANINAIQGEGDSRTTALVFNCQRGALDTVRDLIELGADPNQIVPGRVKVSNNQNKKVCYLDISITAFQKAVVNNHLEVVMLLMEQKITPLSFSTMATACAQLLLEYRSEMTVNAELHLAFPVSSLLFPIYEKIQAGTYDADTIKAGVKALDLEAQQYFKAGNYGMAQAYFCVVLMLHDNPDRLGICYNIASCFKSIGESHQAIQFYTTCMEYAPESKYGKYAAKQLEKLVPDLSVTIGFGK